MKCFVIAMENEAESIIRAMKAERNIVFCGKRILTGRLFGQKVGIVVCGVGKVKRRLRNADCRRRTRRGRNYKTSGLRADLTVP